MEALDSKDPIERDVAWTVFFHTLGILMEYFYSWRPYSLILARLKDVHGMKRRCVSTYYLRDP